MGIATSPAIVGSLSAPPAPEPISPELVLVDPELRAALRAVELERPALQVVSEPGLERPALQVVPLEPPRERESVAPRATPPPAPPPSPAPEAAEPQGERALVRARRRAVRILLPISLGLNAVLIALAVSDSTAPQPSPAPPVLPSASPGGGSPKKPAPKAPPARKAKHSSTTAAPKGTAPKASARRGSPIVPRISHVVVERKLLNLVIQSPSGKLPRALIDRKTGLAKNNLQAVCRASGSRLFLCVVQPARHKPGEGLFVRYRLDHSGTGGTFTGYRYRER